MNYKKFLSVAIEAAHNSGKIIVEGFNNPQKGIEFKGVGDPVTYYDTLSEKIIVETIHSTYPDHSILTEEALSTDNNSDIKWIIDPIDGTVNFTHRIPQIAVSIGVEVDGEIVVGMIYNPILDEMYTATKGGGAFLNNKSISVSNESDPKKSIIGTGFPYKKNRRMDKVIHSLQNVAEQFEGFRRIGSAAMNLAMVASGKYEGFYVEALHPWDTAAGIILIKEAGGIITNYQGENYDIYQKTIVASNGLIHDTLINIFKDIEAPK